MRGRRPDPADPAQPEPARSDGSECTVTDRRQGPELGGPSTGSALPVHFTSDFTSAGHSPSSGPALRNEDVHSPWPAGLVDSPRAHYHGAASTGRTTATTPATATDLGHHRGRGGVLPLPPMSPPAQRSDLYCTVTPIDCHGRLADRSPLRAAGWPPGQPISITATPDGRLVTVRAVGPNTTTRDGHLLLPAHVRRACRLATGDRLLVIVTTAPTRLTVYPMTTVETIIRAWSHASAPDAGPSS